MRSSGFQKKNVITQAVLSALLLAPTVAFSADEEEKSKFEVIEVTAQKRVQNVMEVPVAVSTVNDDTIKESGSLMLGDIDKFIPGFDFGAAFSGDVTQAGVSMRGISSPNISVGGDPSSAVFFDDVYMPRAAQNVVFSDMERIEVLKGPQGTLFGRNAAMGVVSIVPNAPNEDNEGFVKARVGTDNLKKLEAMLNLPITDNFYMRANVLSNRQDGFIDNVTDPDWHEEYTPFSFGKKGHDAARIAFKWDISGATTLQLAYDYDKLEQSPAMAIGISEWAYMGGKDHFSDKAQNDVLNAGESRDMYGVTAKLNHEFSDQLSMKYILSYRDWETENRQDEDGTADPTRYFHTSNNEDSDILYTELQFSYVNDNISAVTGFSYSKESVSQTTEMVMTTDTAARLITGDLNQQIAQLVDGQVLAGLAAQGIDSDAAAQFAGLGNTLEEALANYKALNGIVAPVMDHMWNADELAMTLNALGLGADIMAGIGFPDAPFTADFINSLPNGVIPFDVYEIVSASLPAVIGSPAGYIPEIFGPQYAGQLWQESVNNTGDFTNYGIFADVDYAITDKWNVIAGVRYSKDEKDFTWYIPRTSFNDAYQNNYMAYASGDPAAATSVPVSNVLFDMADTAASNSWDQVTGRFVTSYKFASNSMVYVSASTGYKSGGYDSLVAPTTEQQKLGFEPEETMNIELGYKGILFDQVILNTSVYNLELTNQQKSVNSKDPNDVSGAAKPIIINQDTTITGLELDLRWKTTDSLTLGLISDVRSMEITTPEFYNSEAELVAKQTNKDDAAVNYTLTLDFMPDWEYADGGFNFHIDYQFVENLAELNADLSDAILALEGYTDDQQDLNARFSWYGDNVEIAIWGSNLMDNRYVSGGGGLTADVLGTGVVRVNRGMQAGIDIVYNF